MGKIWKTTCVLVVFLVLGFRVSGQILPTQFDVTGGGPYCLDGQPNPVMLSGSQTTAEYYLSFEGDGAAQLLKSGTGNPLTWTAAELNTIPDGLYVVMARRNIRYATMGSFTKTKVDFAAGTLLGGGSSCASTGATISLSSAEANVAYQLKRNGVNFGTERTATQLPWTGLTEPGSYTVTARSLLCPSLIKDYTNAIQVDIYQDPVAAITASKLIICNNVPETLSAQTSGGYTYEWSKAGTILGTDPSLQIGSGGLYTLKVANGLCVKESSVDIKSSTSPAAISGVSGLLLNFANQTNIIEVQGSNDATEFKYPADVMKQEAGGDVPGRKVYLGMTTTRTITVTPSKEGCDGTPYNFQFSIIDPTRKLPTDGEALRQTSDNLISKGYGYYFLDKHVNNYPGCISAYGPVKVKLGLDLGKNYNHGRAAFTASANIKITAYSDIPGQEQTWDVTLAVNESAPEQVFVKEIDINPALVKFIKIEKTSASASTVPTTSDLWLWAQFSEEDVVNVSQVSTSLILPQQNADINSGQWEQVFSWNSCADVTSYVFQLIRLYGDTPPTEEQWHNALTLETEQATPSIQVTMAEGSALPGEAYYYWRVIPLGNQQKGIADPTNWGSASAVNRFTYRHPEDNKNWIYSRTFTEGNRVSEQVAYANGLQQVAQQQTRIQGENRIVATQTYQDYVGRNAVASLPVPTALGVLGYVPQLLKVGTKTFDASEFDTDTRLRAPATVADASGYYSGTDNGFNDRVASAEGYPYTRTLFGPDGRVREQSGVGKKHSVNPTDGGKTVKTYYGNPEEGELVKVFGAEAPQISSVQKITTVDANGTGTVTYKTKDGKVVATALTLPASTQLTPLSGTASQNFFGEITGYERVDENTIVARKPLFFLENKAINIAYTISAGDLKELCNGSAVGNFSKTCDYFVEIILYKEDDSAPEVLASGTLNDANKQWTAPAITTTLTGGMSYVLEKRITLNKNNQVSAYADEIAAKYRAIYDAQPQLVAVKNYVAQKQFVDLKNYLQQQVTANPAVVTYDASLKQYAVKVVDGPCPDYIYIPEVELCPQTATYDASCLMSDGVGPEQETFWQYFQNYYAGTDTDVSQALYFNDRSQLTAEGKPVRILFTQSTFDGMMANLMLENGLTCAELWEVWKQEVPAYAGGITLNLNVNTGDMGADGSAYAANQDAMSSVSGQSYSLFENLVKSVDALLAGKMGENDEVCTTRLVSSSPYQFFIKRNILYGNFSASQRVAPDLFHAYSLVYYNYANENAVRALKFYAGYAETDIQSGTAITDPAATFAGISTCLRFRYSQSTDYNDNSALTEAEALNGLNQIKTQCNEACGSKREAFTQALIHALMIQNPNTVIEHYRTYIDPAQDGDVSAAGIQDKWMGFYDVMVSTTGYTIGECELNAMVDALIKNCREKYCGTSLTAITKIDPLTGKQFRGYGTEEEQQRIRKAFLYGFELQITQNCSADLVSGVTMSPGSGRIWLEDVGFTPSQSTPYEAYPFLQKVLNEGIVLVRKDVLTLNSQIFYVVEKRTFDNQLVWQYPIGNVLPTDVAVDASGNTIVLWQEFGTSRISKIDRWGYTRWSRNALVNSAHLYTHGSDIYIVGHASSDIDFRGATSISTEGSFIAKYDSDMQYQWHALISGSHIAFGMDGLLKFTSQGSIIFNFVTNNGGGGNSLTISVGQSSLTHYYTELSGYDFLAVSISSVGQITGIKKLLHFDGGLYPRTSIDNEGSIYLIGHGPAKVFSSQWSQDVIGDYLMKFNPNFEIQWLRKINNSPTWVFYDDYAQFNFDVVQNLIVWFGGFSGKLDMETDPDKHYIVTANGANSYFVACYSKNGDFVKGINTEISGGKVSRGGFFVGDDVYIGGITSGLQGASNARVDVLPPTGANAFVSRYKIGLPICTFSTPICFKFTQPLEVVVPPGMEDYVYDPQPISCEKQNGDYILNTIASQQERLINMHSSSMRQQYYQQCTDPAKMPDKFTISYSTAVYQYTLYYYDRAGNLIRTVPPAGVATLDVSTAAKLATAKTTIPQHTMVTEYQYNSLGQLVREHAPDATNKPDNLVDRPLASSTDAQLDQNTYYASFIYSSKTLLRFSQNAQQKLDGKYSYTKYDALARVIEVGEATGFDYNLLYSKRDDLGAASYPTIGTSQVTRTVYSDEFSNASPVFPALPAGFTQSANLRNRVSYALLDPDPATPEDETFTVYDYDTHGNVAALAQYIPGLGWRVVEYEYDLISGKVNKVVYSRNQPDQFMHRYEYDANNRLTTVFTSTDGVIWDRDARYEYFAHGPLKRTVIGEDQVQGVDYTYTIHGWLKALNHPALDKTNDPMQDGAGTSTTGRDLFGMALGYYDGDYVRTGAALSSASPTTANVSTLKQLYNGNIASWGSNIGEWINPAAEPHKTLYPNLAAVRNRQWVTHIYGYDELNRILSSTSLSGAAFASLGAYNTTYTYDGNGNLMTMINGYYASNVYIDRLTYAYEKASGNSGRQVSNRLLSVAEAEEKTTFPDDVEKAGNSYSYDATGNLVTSSDESGLKQIAWTPYGKVKSVTKADGSGRMEYGYDAAGNRVLKKFVLPNLTKSHFYVRDASGNIMAVYEKLEQSGGTPETKILEIPLYGSSRLGRFTGSVDFNVQPGEVRQLTDITKAAYEGVNYLMGAGTTLTLEAGFAFTSTTSNGTTSQFSVRVSPPATGGGTPGPDYHTRRLNNKQYELNDHLGNVRAVVTDLKLSTYVNNAPTNYEPYMVSLSNYYPFGMDMPDRVWSASGKYRYGFNGKEKDSEGEWGATGYDYGFRIYNPSIGKFLSVDPLTRSYPMLTPYQFASNSPVANIDVDGLEGYWYIYAGVGGYGKTVQKISIGSAEAVESTVTNLYNFVRRDAWKAETWKQGGLFLEEVMLSSSPYTNTNTPRLDASVKKLEDDVINGDGYTRSKFATGLVLDIALGYVSDKGLSKLGPLAKQLGKFEVDPTVLNSGFPKLRLKVIQGRATAIGKMDVLKMFDDVPNVDTWHKSGRIPRGNDPQISWAENRAWLQQRIDRGDTFIMTMDPAKLPASHIKGSPNGWFTKLEYDYLMKHAKDRIIYSIVE